MFILKQKKECDRKMRKNYIIVWIVIGTMVIALGVIFGVIWFQKNLYLQPKTETKLVSKGNNLENETKAVANIQTETKTSPNSLFIFKTYYKGCKHIIEEKVDIPKELVNQTEEEIKKAYENWKIEKFETTEVVFYQEKEGICNEHYIIKENNGYVAIYSIDEYEKETLKETTEIVTNYLPQTDKLRLKEGIKVTGKEELNATLEDYE